MTGPRRSWKARGRARRPAWPETDAARIEEQIARADAVPERKVVRSIHEVREEFRRDNQACIDPMRERVVLERCLGEANYSE